MTDEPTEDEKAFGEGKWVYCKQHLRPHKTGWCTIGPEDKVALEADNYAAAYTECIRKGFEIYDSCVR